jgi:predicted nucleic acid-binding protein
MIATYLDSSALVRLCVGEGDIEHIEEAMSGLPVTSVLAAVEVPAAILARFHRDRIDAEERDLLLVTAEGVLQSVGQVGLSAAVRREAVAIARDHLLRSIDAIHVGTAVVVQRHQQRRGNSLRFCTGDHRQGVAAAGRLGPDCVTVLAPL